MRLTFWYLEFCVAAAEGDIGRVFEIIKVRVAFIRDMLFPGLSSRIIAFTLFFLGRWMHKLWQRAARASMQLHL